MKKTLALLVVGVSMIFWFSSVIAAPVTPTHRDGPQDTLLLADVQWHELGNGTPMGFFPEDEFITSNYIEWDETACVDPNGPQDNPNIPNYRVAIQNQTNIYWHNLHYVADWEVTTITNYDGWIGNPGAQDEWYAFKIDNVGLNTPLLFESINPDLVFEPGESWEFIIQDYTNINGVAPHMFTSLGIAGASADPPDYPSSGSIIATPVPLPGAALLLFSGLAFLGAFRKKFRK